MLQLQENQTSKESKKQDVVARSSAEEKYQAMALATCELIRLKQLLQELRYGGIGQMKLIRDNHVIFHITNPIFHKRTKHTKVDCHFKGHRSSQGALLLVFSTQMIKYQVSILKA